MKLRDYPQDKAVYTTKSVAKEHAPVLYVSLDEEEDFQMFGDEDPDSSNAMIVALEQMLEIDTSLLQLPDIIRGQAYTRENKEAIWKLYK